MGLWGSGRFEVDTVAMRAGEYGLSDVDGLRTEADAVLV